MIYRFLITCFTLLSLQSSAQQVNVYFHFDQWEIIKNARATLDSLVADKRIISVELFGHTDQLGTQAYNYRLSEKRAEAVRAYLVQLGFPTASITTIKAFGKEQPAIDKLDPQSRQANRRVTIVPKYAIVPPSVDTPVATVPEAPLVVTPPPPSPKEKLIDEIIDTSTKVGQTIILKNINFYGGTHRFLPTAIPPLQELLEVMQKVPTLVIEIQGHICCRDDEGDGMDNETGEPILSHNRARAVYEFLVRRGIERNRMTYRGFGHKYPLYEYEVNEAQRTANRRVEIKIVRK